MRLRNRLLLWLTAAAGAYLALLLGFYVLLQPYEAADLQVLSVVPEGSVLGEDLLLQVRGTGFSRRTQLILSPDLGNEAALLATIPSWNRLQGAAVDGTLAYLANGYRGVQVIDVSRPEHPVHLGSLRTPGTAWKIVLEGGLAYLADREGGVQIIDIADPHQLRIVAGLSIGNAVDLAVKGDRAYVANSRIGLQLIDVADPRHPRLIGEVRIPGTASAVTVRGDHAFLADARGAMHVLAVGKGEPATVVASVRIPDITLGIAAGGNFAYVTGRRGVHVIDIRDPRRPRLTATVPTRYTARGIVLQDGLAYVATDEGMLVLDLAVPANPRPIGLYRIPGTNHEVALDSRQKLAYVCNGSRGLAVVDISEPRLSLAGASVDLPSTLNDFEQVEGVLFGVGPEGMSVIDLDRPERWAVIGSLALEFPPQKLALAENRAYLLAGHDSTISRGIYIVDTSDPRQLQPRGFLPLTGLSGVSSLAGTGNLLFIGTRGEIHIFNAGEQAAPPQHIASLATQGTVTALLPDGPFLYAGDETAGLLAIDISEPRQPRLLGGAALPWHLQAYSRPKRIVKGNDGTILMADGRNGMLVYQFVDARPRLVASLPVDGFAGDLAIAGNLVYVLVETVGLLTVDIHDPRNPKITGVVPTVDTGGKIAVRNDWMFALNREKELTAFPAPITAREMALLSTTELSAVFPAPAIPGTYSLQLADGLRTTVFPGAVTVHEQAPAAGR